MLLPRAIKTNKMSHYKACSMKINANKKKTLDCLSCLNKSNSKRRVTTRPISEIVGRGRVVTGNVLGY